MAQVQLRRRFGAIICDKLYASSVKNMLPIFFTGLKTFAKNLSKALDDCHRCCSIDSVLWIVLVQSAASILRASLKKLRLNLKRHRSYICE
jgi:hypothetical protein